MHRFHARFSAATGIMAMALAACSAGPRVMLQQDGNSVLVDTQLNLTAGPFKVLHNFAGTPDGADAYAALIDVSGTLYSTTALGGTNHDGTVFKITTAGAERVIFSFAGTGGGSSPEQTLLNDGGTFYGVTQYSTGGSDNCGTVFSVTPAGSQKLLHLFAATGDGCEPMSPLVAVNGTFYGTTFTGGTHNVGTFYRVTKTGSEKALHSFAATPSPEIPLGTLVNVNGTLYGISPRGGTSNNGTFYSATTTGTLKVLYNFSGGNDGSEPYGGLVNVNGTLYGVTSDGGTHNLGTVYSITTSGVHKVLYNFGSKSGDGSDPQAALIDVSGTLYGTTYLGGASNVGSIFKVTTDGTEAVLHSFNTTGGRYPNAPLLNVGGVLYGTTTAGGTHGFGVVFSYLP